MVVVIVQVKVKPEYVDAFKRATVENAIQSRGEPGVARFDVIQETDTATAFVLIEAYRNPEGATAHKDTAHYKKWRELVAPMMAEPRTSRKFVNIDPPDAAW